MKKYLVLLVGLGLSVSLFAQGPPPPPPPLPENAPLDGGIVFFIGLILLSALINKNK